MKYIKLYEEWNFPLFNKNKNTGYIIQNDMDDDMDNPFNTLSDFLNNKLNVDLDCEIGKDCEDADFYLSEKINKILNEDISKENKIKKMINFITKSFEISQPPYKWTNNKKDILENELENLFNEIN